jgi:IS4 transposase
VQIEVKTSPFGRKKQQNRLLKDEELFQTSLNLAKHLVFLTNNLEIPLSLTIAKLYKSRWQIELFFKWIKGHLLIKHYFGTSPNAVKSQIWIAVAVYLMVAILHKQL